MFKSVFAKYLTAFAVIILISFVILAGIVSSMVRNYASDSKKEEVEWIAATTQGILTAEYKKNPGNMTFTDFIDNNKSSLKQMMDYVSMRESDLTVFVTDEGGCVLLIGTVHGIVETTIIPPEEMREITPDGVYSKTGTLGGLLNGHHLIYGLKLAGGANGTLGYVFVCSSSTSEESLISIMTETIIMASLWVMLAAMIAVYFISDRIIGPLRTMTVAAKEFGSGNFNARVHVNGSDEIAELGGAFNHMAESLEHLETMRNSFLANVSHDLRTPMTTISGFIDGINSGAIPQEKQSHYLNIISGEVHRLSRLVSMLLDISKLESGDRKFVPAPFDICETARLILISFEQKIEAKNLDVVFECDQDCMIAMADKDAIYQVLYNLCDNAIKFSKENAVFRIGIRRAEKKKLHIAVYNEGVGIPKNDIAYVFDRFYKSDKSRGLDKNGVGLGLYIVKTIVEAQGESIGVRSEEGKFCEFTFTLTESDRRPADSHSLPSER